MRSIKHSSDNQFSNLPFRRGKIRIFDVLATQLNEQSGLALCLDPREGSGFTDYNRSNTQSRHLSDRDAIARTLYADGPTTYVPSERENGFLD